MTAERRDLGDKWGVCGEGDQFYVLDLLYGSFTD